MAGRRGRAALPPPPTEAELDEQRYWERVEAKIAHDRAQPAPAREVEHDFEGRLLPARSRRPIQPIAAPMFRLLVKRGMPMTEVPERYWTTASRTADRSPVAVVTCVCGEERVAPEGEYPTECACERWFFFDRTRVWSLGRKPVAA